jgi:hypothetical protein
MAGSLIEAVEGSNPTSAANNRNAVFSAHQRIATLIQNKDG